METFNLQAGILKALPRPTRLPMLETHRDGEQCVSQMEVTLGIRQSSILQQLMILQEAGLVGVRRDGLRVPGVHKRARRRRMTCIRTGMQEQIAFPLWATVPNDYAHAFPAARELA